MRRVFFDGIIARLARFLIKISKPPRFTLSARQFRIEARADVAQLVEQPIRNRQVSGSSPLVGSMFPILPDSSQSLRPSRQGLFKLPHLLILLQADGLRRAPMSGNATALEDAR